MCTLTLLRSAQDWILTFSRDEHIMRAKALPPQVYAINQNKIWFPKDPAGQGSWMATNGKQIAVLLNGGFTKHVRQPSYRHSRGIIVLEALSAHSIETLAKSYDLTQIEPFTLVHFDTTTLKVLEWVWTGEERNIQWVNEESMFRCSYTLYSHEIQQMRKKWFHDFLRNSQELGPHSLWDFHLHTQHQDQENGLVIKRNNGVQTLSVAQISSLFPQQFKYLDLIDQQEFLTPII